MMNRLLLTVVDREHPPEEGVGVAEEVEVATDALDKEEVGPEEVDLHSLK